MFEFAIRLFLFRQDEHDKHFKLFVTVDITSDNRISGAGLDRILRQQIQSTNKIGEYTVHLDNHYKFTTTEGTLCEAREFFFTCDLTCV